MGLRASASMRYLSVTNEANPNHSVHMRDAAAGAARAIIAVGDLMANMGGAGEYKRRLLVEVARIKLLYAVGRNVEHLRRIMTPLRKIRGYRTISTDYVEVFSSLVPPDIIAEARAAVFRKVRDG